MPIKGIASDNKIKVLDKKKITSESKSVVRMPTLFFSDAKKFKDLSSFIYVTLASYQLTKDELSSFLAEKPYIKETYKEIQDFIESEVDSKHILKTGEDDLLSLSPESMYFQKKRQTRESSLEWYKSNTVLTGFYNRLKYNYLNVFKKLTVSNQNGFNKIQDCTKNPMEITINGQPKIGFTSQDYLGLAHHPKVIEACVDAVKKYGYGSNGSRILSGTTHIHRALEERLAEFCGAEDAVVYPSGFVTNLAWTTMLREDSVLFYDSIAHASIRDGIQMSGLLDIRFRHNRVDFLEKKLNEHKDTPYKSVIVEGIYSMDGDILDLKPIHDICKKHKALLVVDEAHSYGVLGKTGRGVAEHFGMSPDCVDIKMGTLSKALGGVGGFLAGKGLVMDMLRFTSRPFLFTTSLPVSTQAASLASLELLMQEPERVELLQEKSTMIREELTKIGFNTLQSQTQIIPVLIGDEVLAGNFQAMLQDEGIALNAVVFPAVGKKRAILRVCISAIHSDEQLQFFLEKMTKVAKKLEFFKS